MTAATRTYLQQTPIAMVTLEHPGTAGVTRQPLARDIDHRGDYLCGDWFITMAAGLAAAAYSSAGQSGILRVCLSTIILASWERHTLNLPVANWGESSPGENAAVAAR